MGLRVPRVSRRAGASVVAVAAIGAAVGWGVAPSSAAPTPASTSTSTIAFTGDGPTPASLVVKYGTKVVFENDVNPAAKTPVLGTVSGAVRSVTVTISGATQKPFTLSPGQSATVGPYYSGSQPFVVHYAARYDARMVAGLLPGHTTTEHGTLTILQRSGRAASASR